MGVLRVGKSRTEPLFLKKSVVVSSRFMEVHSARTGRTFIIKYQIYGSPRNVFCGFTVPAISKHTSKEHF